MSDVALQWLTAGSMLTMAIMSVAQFLRDRGRRASEMGMDVSEETRTQRKGTSPLGAAILGFVAMAMGLASLAAVAFSPAAKQPLTSLDAAALVNASFLMFIGFKLLRRVNSV